MALTPAKFDYIRPKSLDQAIEILSDNPDGSKILGGGQSLIPLLKTRIVNFERLVDVGHLPKLNYLEKRDGNFCIGSTTRISDIENSTTVQREFQMLHEASLLIADPPVRNMGTAGGNVSHADPGNDLPVIMIAHDSSFVLEGRSGPKTVKAENFFIGPYETLAKNNEVMTELQIPVPEKYEGSAFVKVRRMSGDFSLVSSASRLRVGEDQRITDSRVVVASVTPVPTRLKEIEEILIGNRVDDSILSEIRKKLPGEIELLDDPTVKESYRHFAMSNAVAKSVEVAYRRAI